ncbi:Protein of unknown function DUF3515 [Actinobacteria bacterium OK074]|nr:Protein of unknown function DUF3515 [Actinobacteria bacterium OK074]
MVQTVRRVLNSVRRRSRGSQARIALAVAAALALALTAVLLVHATRSPADGIAQAPHADAPACARIAKSYPAVLGGHRRTDTSSTPGIAVWGDKAVVLRCGLTPPAATTDPCVAVDGVDWVYRQSASRDGRKVIITYGREPAVEVTLSTQDTAVDGALVDLSGLVRPIRQHDHCIDSTGS